MKCITILKIVGFMGMASMVLADALVPMTPAQIQAAGIALKPLTKTDTAAVSVSVSGNAQWPADALRVVASPIDGTVLQISVLPMQTVKAQQSLLQVFSPTVLAMQSEWLSLQAQTQLAKEKLNRDQDLFKEGIIAQKRVLESQSEWTLLSLQKQEKERLLKFYQATKTTTTHNVSIKAEKSGVVTDVLVSLGQQVSAGTPLFKLVEANHLWLALNVAKEKSALIKAGDKVQVKGCDEEGVVKSIANFLNENTQTVAIQAYFQNKSRCIKPQQYINATIVSSRKSGGQWQVPNSAILNKNNQRYIFKKVEKGFKPIAINILNKNTDYAVISSEEILPADNYAVSGMLAIKSVWQGFGLEQAPVINAVEHKK
jgi:cobalt-zinc-cadmium efflux system membrane fusion protein